MTKTIEQLQAKVAELEAENGKLHEQVDLQVPKMAFTQLKEQLAAAQLNNKLLREALETLNKVSNIGCDLVEKALAQPSDTFALDAYVAEKVKEAGKFDVWRTNPYTKVLETSIKQLTRQRDLAVEPGE